MAGERVYKEFDTSSVISSSTTKDTLSFGRYTLRKRELILAIIAVVALVLVIVLAIVLIVRANDGGADATKSCPTTSSQSDQHTGGQVCTTPEYCDSPQCLAAAVYQKPIMNEAVDPCHDFYTFACGHYPTHHPQTALQADVTAVNEILDLNIQRLVQALGYHVNHMEQNWEKKLREFIYSCDNHFDKMELRGRPMIDKIIKPMGGWWVFGDDVLNNFSLQESLEKVHVDFWTDAFFSITVNTNSKDWNKKIVELSSGGIGMHWSYYGRNPTQKPFQDAYKQYMRILAITLSLDYRITPNQDKIQQFINDVYEVEYLLANILYSSAPVYDPHHPDNLMTLSELNIHLNDTIDMVHYMKALFNQYPNLFTENTNVAVGRLFYFNDLGYYLKSYLDKGEEGERKLHNYLMWRVISGYAQDLSWDYIHSKRRLDMMLYGHKDDSSGYLYCFMHTMNAFSSAVNSVFIRNFVKEEGKKQAQEMMEKIKAVVMQGVANLSWMTDNNRQYAMSKIQHTLYKIGFPEYLVQDGYLDNLYSYVNIDKDDYFGNILNINKMRHQYFNRIVGQGVARTEWQYHVFDPLVEYYNPWHELIVTSAMIQNPLFSAKGPAYYNYGGIGSILATNLIHAIDEIGASYKEDGSHYGDWWSNTTRNHYAEIRKCAINAQNGTVIGPFTYMDEIRQVNISKYASYWAPQLLAGASGIRLSFKAYMEKEKKDGIENLPPGFSKYDTRKMFFISYAQSHCQNTLDAIKEHQLRGEGRYPSKNRVNLAMKQVPEFLSAFNCPAVNPKPKQCLLFDVKI